MNEITRSEMEKSDKENSVWYRNWRKDKLELKHDTYRMKFMEILTMNIPNSKHNQGIGMIYRYCTVPFLRIFRKRICGVYRQWEYDWSLGVELYDKRYYEIVKKVLQNYDNINSSNSVLFKEYE